MVSILLDLGMVMFVISMLGIFVVTVFDCYRRWLDLTVTLIGIAGVIIILAGLVLYHP
jgi:hypothetical protein